jgi:uncharacterized membrane protein YeaQ/YmgE (transglycosylase-associated protein family)
MPFSPGSIDDPLSPVALTTLLTALGLSSTAGLRAYLPLLILGIASDIRGPDGAALLPVQDQFHVLGHPLVLIVLAVLVVLEFLADKIPGLDHVSDVVHTVIRPAAGALIMAASANTLSDSGTTGKIVAAVIGAIIALATHSMKASTRAAVTTTTAGVGNPVASFLEDLLVIGVILLLVLAPIIGFIALVLLLFLFFKAARAAFRGIRRMFGGGKSPPGRIASAPNAYSDTTVTYNPSGDSISPTGTTYQSPNAPSPLPPVTGGYAANVPYPPDAETIQRPSN